MAESGAPGCGFVCDVGAEYIRCRSWLWAMTLKMCEKRNQHQQMHSAPQLRCTADPYETLLGWTASFRENAEPEHTM